MRTLPKNSWHHKLWKGLQKLDVFFTRHSLYVVNFLPYSLVFLLIYIIVTSIFEVLK